MSEPAIVVDNLGKKYKIGLRRESYHTFRDLMVSMAKAPFRRFRALGEATTAADEFWALRDVSFEVQPGEVVGIIGRNGAGKSTLLKILSRITEPTEGMARIHGRVGSLLEVGTGFHPELTGRENVFLNGAILGMKKAEISAKFDEIVAFAEVDKFLDTPVKRYSSGMRVRLAFAVAAHLDPEILIIDEVLAVGDAAFQRKCLGKMSDVSSAGRTVLFVSHNMSAVEALCGRGILLECGHIAMQDDASAVIARYWDTGTAMGTASLAMPKGDNWDACYTRVSIIRADGQASAEIPMGQGFTFEFQFKACRPLADPSFGFVLQGPMRENLLRVTSRETLGSLPPIRKGGIVRVHIESLNLLPGTYSFTIGLSNAGQQIALIEDAVRLNIIPTCAYSTGKLPSHNQAIIFEPCTWSCDYE